MTTASGSLSTPLPPATPTPRWSRRCPRRCSTSSRDRSRCAALAGRKRLRELSDSSPPTSRPTLPARSGASTAAWTCSYPTNRSPQPLLPGPRNLRVRRFRSVLGFKVSSQHLLLGVLDVVWSVSVVEASFLVVDPCWRAADLGWCGCRRVAVYWHPLVCSRWRHALVVVGSGCAGSSSVAG